MTSALPVRAPYSLSCASAQEAPPRATPSFSAASHSNALKSDSAGVWLNTSCVSAGALEAQGGRGCDMGGSRLVWSGSGEPTRIAHDPYYLPFRKKCSIAAQVAMVQPLMTVRIHLGTGRCKRCRQLHLVEVDDAG